ncbi:hypothetical protein B0H14DRAFT_2270373, partial [Mycena olivaceomarginata]
VIVDVNSCRSLQCFYVMLSRAKGLKKMAVLSNFNPRTMSVHLGEEFRKEFARLEVLDSATA